MTEWQQAFIIAVPIVLIVVSAIFLYLRHEHRKPRAQRVVWR